MVSKQLQYLWSKPVVCCLFDKVLHYDQDSNHAVNSCSNQQSHVDFTSSIQSSFFIIDIT